MKALGTAMPTLRDVLAARANVYRYLKATPLYRYSSLNDATGLDLYVKHENHLPCGSFKVRGGLNLAASLADAERKAGLFTASTGNHGQSIAFAARAYHMRATIAVPEEANPAKVAAMRGLGAEVVSHARQQRHVDRTMSLSWELLLESWSDSDLHKSISPTTLCMSRASDPRGIVGPHAEYVFAWLAECRGGDHLPTLDLHLSRLFAEFHLARPLMLEPRQRYRHALAPA